MAAVLKSPLRIAASGRTDAGVHAHAQCFHADVPAACRMTPQNWQAALNAHLPASIRITAVEPVAPEEQGEICISGPTVMLGY
jgi:tRNA pseudouridine38-40 synthase